MEVITVHNYKLSDLPAVVALSDQLGYPIGEKEAEGFLDAIVLDPNQEVLVAADSQGNAVGWIHVFLSWRVFMQPIADLGGLIVDEAVRSRSIGEKLLHAAENWAKEKGCIQLVVRSNVEREEAHRFYQRLGYEDCKRQAVFRKGL